MEKQAEAIRVEQIKLYESYADGVLRRDAYIEKKKALSEKLAALQDSIRTEKEEQECADELDKEIRALTKQASEKTYIGGLTKECVEAFVSICNELFTWADVYDTANHDERRAILQQFIKEIRVRKDYEISITLNASFEQVEQLKAVSTYDGAGIFEEISEKGA